MAEFYRGPFETAVGQGEMLVEVQLPRRPHGSSAYEKVERRAGDWAVVSCGAAVELDGDVVADARLGLAGVGPSTTAIPIAEVLRGGPPTDERIDEAAAIAAASCNPVSDLRGSEAYKRHLAGELTRRALRRTIERIRAKEA